MSDLIPHLYVNICIYGDAVFSPDGLTHKKALPFLSVVQAVKGEYSITMNDTEYISNGENGRCIICPANVKQIIVHKTLGEPIMQGRWVFLDVSLSGYINLTNKIIPKGQPDDELSMELSKSIDILSILGYSDDIDAIVKKHEIIFKIISSMLKFYNIKIDYGETNPIYNALSYIDKNFSSKVLVDNLALICNMSPSQFYRKFKDITGHTPIEYLSSKRLVKAMLLLARPMTLAEIASNTGFYDEFHFSKEFKKKYNISPKEYRNKFLNKQKLM